LRRDDAAPLLAMWNATARFDPLTPELLAEKTWDDPGFEPGLALVCEDEGAVAGFAMGVVRDAAAGSRGIVKLAAAASDRRRRGIGSRLLDELESRFLERGVSAVRLCESAPNYLTPGVDSRYSAAPYFFEKQGYERIGEACNMSVDLSAPSYDLAGAERRVAGHGYTVRRAGAGDRASLAALLAAHWPSWQDEVDRALGNDPATVFLCERGGVALAFAAWDANNRGTGWFGPMGTAPEARRRGLGQLLLIRCLDDIRDSGLAYATIPWVDPVEFYRRCAGAAVERVFHRYEKVLHPCD
jgi:ribosomal protein S18 acetylase RimI-like enzyme